MDNSAKIYINGESKLIKGHVLDVSAVPLLAALRRYDPQLYLKWNAKKRAGRGCWELRRNPELKSARVGRKVESPRGPVRIPGDIYEFQGYTLCVPKYNETHFENHVKDFDYLTYGMLDWISKHDAWKYGYRGKNTMSEAQYLEAKYEEKIDEEASAERDYMIKQHRTQFNDFRDYINTGGNPYRLIDYMNKI